MAESKIQNTVGTEALDYTLINDFTLASWGYVSAFKMGGLGIIAVSGLRRPTATTTNTPAIRLTKQAKGNSTSVFGTGASGGQIIAQMVNGDTDLLINGVLANTNYFGFIIFPI